MITKGEWACIFNPKAGPETQRGLLAALRSGLDSDIAWVETQGPQHATILAKELVSKGYKKIIAAGGDGTINEVGQGLLNTDAALGLLPLGSGNGLLRHLHLPLKLENAIRYLSNAKPHPMDAGVLNGYPFFCTSGIGFDAQVAKAFDSDPQRGFKAYFRITWQQWQNRTPFTFSTGQRAWENVIMVTFANASQFGNNARIAPAAQVNDGQIEIVVSKNPGAFNVPLVAWSLFAGDYKSLSFVDSFSSEGGAFSTDKALPFHCDGEYFDATNIFTLNVIPNAIKVFC